MKIVVIAFHIAQSATASNPYPPHINTAALLPPYSLVLEHLFAHDRSECC